MKKPDPEASAPSEGGQITSSFYSRASLPTLPFFGGGLSWTGWAGVCQREMAHAFPLLNKKKYSLDEAGPQNCLKEERERVIEKRDLKLERVLRPGITWEKALNLPTQ